MRRSAGSFRADLDIEVEGIVDRIHGINRRIRKMLDETLEQYDLASGDWKVLCSLRWHGKPHRRSAGDLARIADLSSGAMTNRLDQLEKAGLVKRLPDPDDRRGVLVELTPRAAGSTRRRSASRPRRSRCSPRRCPAREGAAERPAAARDAGPGVALSGRGLGLAGQRSRRRRIRGRSHMISAPRTTLSRISQITRVFSVTRTKFSEMVFELKKISSTA